MGWWTSPFTLTVFADTGSVAHISAFAAIVFIFLQIDTGVLATGQRSGTSTFAFATRLSLSATNSTLSAVLRVCVCVDTASETDLFVTRFVAFAQVADFACFTSVSTFSTMKGMVLGVCAESIAEYLSRRARAFAFFTMLADFTGVSTCTTMFQRGLYIEASAETSLFGFVGTANFATSIRTDHALRADPSASSAVRWMCFGVIADPFTFYFSTWASTLTLLADMSGWARFSTTPAVTAVGVGIHASTKARCGCTLGALGCASTTFTKLSAGAGILAFATVFIRSEQIGTSVIAQDLLHWASALTSMADLTLRT